MAWLRRTTPLLALLLLAAVAWLGLPVVRARLERPPAIQAVTAVREDTQRLIAVTGRIRARQRNELGPVTRGRLVELEREEGDPVQAGEVLARLDDRTLRADIEEASARLLEAEDRVEFAGRDVRRLEQLAVKGSSSQRDLDDAQLVLSVAERTAAAARMRKESLQAQLEDLVLRSPLDGVVLERPVDPGQTVGPGDVVYIVATEERPLVEAEVDERFLAELAVGQSGFVRPTGRSDITYPVRTVFVGRNIDRLSGTVPVRFDFLEEPPSWPVGLTLDINLKVAEHAQALLLPRQAVLDLDSSPSVLVLESAAEAGTWRTVRRSIQAIDWPAERIVILEGIAEETRVALNPQGLPEGSAVRIKDAAE